MEIRASNLDHIDMLRSKQMLRTHQGLPLKGTLRSGTRNDDLDLHGLSSSAWRSNTRETTTILIGVMDGMPTVDIKDTGLAIENSG